VVENYEGLTSKTTEGERTFTSCSIEDECGRDALEVKMGVLGAPEAREPARKRSMRGAFLKGITGYRRKGRMADLSESDQHLGIEARGVFFQPRST